MQLYVPEIGDTVYYALGGMFASVGKKTAREKVSSSTNNG